jgi:pimeloyl-ACP methyl ester carboxylesterase
MPRSSGRKRIGLSRRRVGVAMLLMGSILAGLIVAVGHRDGRPQAAIVRPFFTFARKGQLVWQRGVVRVPLDPSGRFNGHVDLAVEWLHRPGKRRALAFALAGGPGQAATAFRARSETALQITLADHDLVVFDQRGTGSSGRLTCPAAVGEAGPLDVGACADEIGMRRRFYSSVNSARDLNALNHLLGNGHALVYATSAGARVALAFARLYPSSVDRLILNSPEVDNALDDLTLSSGTQVLHALCRDARCPHPLQRPWRDLQTLLARLRRRPMSGIAHGARGDLVHLRLTQQKVLDLLTAGDATPLLRLRLPSLVHAGRNGDPGPLLSEWLTVGSLFRSSNLGTRETAPILLSTNCADGPALWPASADLSARLHRLREALSSLPKARFRPFDRATALRSSRLRPCIHWPDGPSAGINKPLPAVPTLVLQGDLDVRTPLEGARDLVQNLPNGQLMIVPGTVHDAVLGGGLCAQSAIDDFLTDLELPTCKIARGVRVLPAPLTSVANSTSPLRLVAAARETLRGVLDELEELEPGDTRVLAFGGLRGGSARFVYLRQQGVVHNYRFVEGLALTGHFRINRRAMRLTRGVFRVTTPLLSGRLRLTPHRLTGMLGHALIRARADISGDPIP